MGNRKSGDGGARLYLAIMVVGLVVLAAVAAYVQLAPATKIPPEMRRRTPDQAETRREVQVP
jgi:hypothetical protein